MEQPRKNQTMIYFLKQKHESGIISKRVCKEFFYKTLDIGHTPISTSLKEMGESGSFQIFDQRGKHEPSNKTTEEIRTAIRNHIELFQKIESEFARKNIKCLYLSQDLNILKIHRLFQKECEEKYDWEPVKDKVY